MSGLSLLKTLLPWLALTQLVTAAATTAPLDSGPIARATWVYSGTLDDGGQPANGRYDLRLTLLDESGTRTIGHPLTLYAVEVEQGNFNAEVDFGLDLSDAPPLRLRTEVAASSKGAGQMQFVALGDPVRFDPKAALGGVCWDTEGNAGTNPVSNFIGTTDAQPLVLRTRNVQSLRIEPSSVLFNGSPITTNTIAGSSANSVTAGVRGATIGGGGVPVGNSDPDLGLDGPNSISDAYGTVSGGYNNRAGDNAGSVTDRAFATVSGGVLNIANGESSSIGGGEFNTVSGRVATIAGGQSNGASGQESTVAGGNNNRAEGRGSTVSGGSFNRTSGLSSTVNGGIFNTAIGFASVASGEGACAGGNKSWAGGTAASTRAATGGSCVSGSPPASGDGDGDEGAFIWADALQPFQPFVSDGPNRFLVRTTDGATFQRRIGSETNARSPRGYFNVVAGDSGIAAPATPSSTTVASFEHADDAFIVVSSPSDRLRGLIFRSPAGNNEGGLVFSTGGGLQVLSGGTVRMSLLPAGQLSLPTLGSAGATSLCRNASNQIASCSSSARYKHDIEDLDLGLDSVALLRPVGYRWNDGGRADIGFVAEEVAELDERLITYNEAGEIEGVKYDRLTALLTGAVQELAAREQMAGLREAELTARLHAQEKQLAQLQARLQAIESRIRP